MVYCSLLGNDLRRRLARFPTDLDPLWSTRYRVQGEIRHRTPDQPCDSTIENALIDDGIPDNPAGTCAFGESVTHLRVTDRIPRRLLSVLYVSRPSSRPDDGSTRPQVGGRRVSHRAGSENSRSDIRNDRLSRGENTSNAPSREEGTTRWSDTRPFVFVSSRRRRSRRVRAGRDGVITPVPV